MWENPARSKHRLLHPNKNFTDERKNVPIEQLSFLFAWKRLCREENLPHRKIVYSIFEKQIDERKKSPPHWKIVYVTTTKISFTREKHAPSKTRLFALDKTFLACEKTWPIEHSIKSRQKLPEKPAQSKTCFFYLDKDFVRENHAQPNNRLIDGRKLCPIEQSSISSR